MYSKRQLSPPFEVSSLLQQLLVELDCDCAAHNLVWSAAGLVGQTLAECFSFDKYSRNEWLQ